MKTTNPVFTISSAHFLGGCLLQNQFASLGLMPLTSQEFIFWSSWHESQNNPGNSSWRCSHGSSTAFNCYASSVPCCLFPIGVSLVGLGLLLPFGLIAHLSVVDGRDQLVCCLSLLPCVSVVSWGPSPPLNWAQRWLGALGCLFHKQHKCVCFQLCHSQHYRNVHIPAFSVLALGHTAA